MLYCLCVLDDAFGIFHDSRVLGLLRTGAAVRPCRKIAQQNTRNQRLSIHDRDATDIDGKRRY